MDNPFFNSDAKTIKELLSMDDTPSVSYKIPVLQRNYVWEEEKVEELLEDIKRSSDNNERYYFIGGMVFAKDKHEKKTQVIDGQQRLITIILFLNACKTRFESNTDLKVHYQRLINRTALDSKGNPTSTWILELQGSDDLLFQSLLASNENEVKPQSVSQEKMLNAKAAIDSFVLALSDDDLKQFGKYFLENVYVVKTIADNTSTAFTIFETLNNRGSVLQPEDLIKNLFLQILHKDELSVTERFDQEWKAFLTNLQDDKNRWIVPISTFLKHYIMSKGKYLSKDGIYDWFRDNRPESPGKMWEKLSELKYAAKKYREYLDGKGSKSLSALKILRFRQAYVVLLAAQDLNKANKELYESIEKMLESIAFGYTISGAKTNELERKFCIIAKLATEARQDTEKEPLLIKELNDAISAIESRASLALKEFHYTEKGDKKKTFYMLSKMADALDGMIHTEELTIEHILSKKEAERSGIDSKIVMRLGNLTLLTHPDNSAANDGSFKEKRKIYIHQPLRLTSSLAKAISTGTKSTTTDKAISAFCDNEKKTYCPPLEESDWTEEEINRRTVSLVNLAKYVWFN